MLNYLRDEGSWGSTVGNPIYSGETNVGRPEAAPSAGVPQGQQGSSWLSRTWSQVYSSMTLDNIMQTAMGASVGYGVGAVVTAKNSSEEIAGVGNSMTLAGLTSVAWGVGCAVKGEKTKALNRVVAGAALLAGGKLLGDANVELMFSSAKKLQPDLYKKCQTSLREMSGQKSRLDHCLGFVESVFKSNNADSLDGVEKRRDIVFGATYIAGNPARDTLSGIVDATHAEYAQRWNIQHEVVRENLLQNQCQKSEYDSTKVDCVPYWNKIALIRNWLSTPQSSGTEHWRIVADDDMPVTNMNVDPSEAIDLLRQGKDTSVIVARDVVVWNGDPETAVNTGLLFVRHDNQSRAVFDAIWERRNAHGTGADHCRTLGPHFPVILQLGLP